MQTEHLIRGEALRKGEGQHKVVCPICSPQRKKKGAHTFTEGERGRYLVQLLALQCQRCGCLEERYMPARRSNKVSLAVQHNWDDLNDKTINWLKGRGISEDTARKAKIKSGCITSVRYRAKLTALFSLH